MTMPNMNFEILFQPILNVLNQYPEILALNLFWAIYWFFLYLTLSIDIVWGVKIRQFFKKKGQKILDRKEMEFHLQMTFLICSFVVFIYFYQHMFPEMEDGNLINPLQVLAQLSCFLFNFKYCEKPGRERNLLILCFFLSQISSLYLLGIDWKLLSLVFFFFVISIF